MACMLMTADIERADFFRSCTGEPVAVLYYIFFQSHGSGDNFEGRARFIAVHYCLVSPHFLERFILFIFLFVTLQLIDFCLGRLVQCKGSVQVKIRLRRHGNDFTRLWIHYNTGCSRRHFVVNIGLF